MMSDALRAYLGAIPFKEEGPLRPDRTCKLCGSPAPLFDAVDFNKGCNNSVMTRSAIMVEYFRCLRCDLLFTDFFDDWTNTDFAAYIYNKDYVKVDPEYAGIRPERTAEHMAAALRGAEHCRILDFGSGSGLFAQEMGKRGFARIESYDPFVHAAPPNGRFDIVTCFEVIEHSPRPIGTLADIMDFLEEDGLAIIGQTLQPEDIGTIRGDWWYLAPRNGHVTTYSSETLRLYAYEHRLGYDEFHNLFMLSRPALSELGRAILERHKQGRSSVVLAAPPPDVVEFSAWHGAEPLNGRHFRWTREPEVELGLRAFAVGRVRIDIPYHIAITPDFVERSSLRIGAIELTLSARNGSMFTFFDVPDERVRQMVLRTPVPVTPAALGNTSDDRPLGIAIWCG